MCDGLFLLLDWASFVFLPYVQLGSKGIRIGLLLLSQEKLTGFEVAVHLCVPLLSTGGPGILRA